jgi:hypothetical protein
MPQMLLGRASAWPVAGMLSGQCERCPAVLQVMALEGLEVLDLAQNQIEVITQRKRYLAQLSSCCPAAEVG